MEALFFTIRNDDGVHDDDDGHDVVIRVWQHDDDDDHGLDHYKVPRVIRDT